MRGPRRDPKQKIDYGRFTQYESERQLRRRRHRHPLAAGAHPPAARYVYRQAGRRRAGRRRHLRPHQGGRGQLGGRVHHGRRPSDRHFDRRQRGFGARLRPRHSPQVARGGRQRDEHRRQVRRLGLQEDRRPERCRRQGRQHAFERIHGPFGPRRRSPHGDLRAGTRTERYVGERREGEERHFHLVPRRRGGFRAVRLQPRIRRADDPQLHLPESGSDVQFQRQQLRLEKRPAGPAERKHDRGAALSADPPFGRRHRSGDRPRHGLRRELLLVRQRPVHLAGRHASGGVPRGHRQDRQGVLPQGLRPFGHPHVDHRRHFGQGHRPGLRVADQDQARFEGDRAGRVDAQLRRGLSGQAPRRLPAQALRDGADSPEEDRRERKGAQGDFGHPEEGPRDGQEGVA